MHFTSSAITALLVLASTAVPGFAAPLPKHISSLVPHPDALAPRALDLRSVVSLLIPRDAEDLNDIETREPCMRGASRGNAPQLVPREGGKSRDPKAVAERKRLEQVRQEGRRRPTNRPGIDYGRSRLNSGRPSVWKPMPEFKTEQ